MTSCLPACVERSDVFNRFSDQFPVSHTVSAAGGSQHTVETIVPLSTHE